MMDNLDTFLEVACRIQLHGMVVTLASQPRRLAAKPLSPLIPLVIQDSEQQPSMAAALFPRHTEPSSQYPSSSLAGRTYSPLVCLTTVILTLIMLQTNIIVLPCLMNKPDCHPDYSENLPALFIKLNLPIKLPKQSQHSVEYNVIVCRPGKCCDF